jgi:hypothetical protein
MKECLEEVMPNFNVCVPELISDLRCSWIGFAPYNSFEKEEFDDMSVYALISFNNDLIDFQIKVIKFIINHPIYKQHAILRNEQYRFELFKVARKDNALLEEMYGYYLNAINSICGLTSVPRDIVEQEIGCHYLGNPKLFFELLDFSILQGKVYE